MKNKESTLCNCTFLKTVLMILVILGHACSYWTDGWFTGNPEIESKGLELFSTWLGSFHIFAFTLVSGYLFAFKISGGVSGAH